ncbi:MAG: hypothetical protein AAB393_13235, partial [Bacteroidota bacterium]
MKPAQMMAGSAAAGSSEPWGGVALVPVDRSRILVADDEKYIRDVFLTLLRSELGRIRIDVVTNGAEVVEAFRTVHYAVI